MGAPPRTARRRHVLTVGVVALLLLPVALDRDDFPLATYPMYARQRADVVSLTTAIGVTADGRERTLGLEAIGRTDDPLLAVGELRADVRAGRADERCAQIARRVSDSAAGAVDVVVEVVVVTERHDVVDHVRTGDGFRERTVHARCAVSAEVER